MAEQPDVKKLEMRVAELENLLKQYQAPTVDLSKEEIAAFNKVSSALAAFDDWGCGINECRPCRVCVCRVCSVCRVCRVCRVCINECVCGPCNICSSGGGFGGGFSGFGE